MWAKLWLTLAEKMPENGRLAEYGRGWILEAWDLPQRWDLIYERLDSWDQLPSNVDELVSRIELDLEGREPLGEEWARQWQNLNTASPNKIRWLLKAVAWLRDPQNFECFSWPFVWGAAYRGLGDVDLLYLGREWLGQCPPQRPAWGLVWRALADSAIATKEDREMGLVWLAPSFYRRRTWPNIWTHLWGLCPDRRDELLTHGRKWCSRPGGDEGQVRRIRSLMDGSDVQPA